MFQVHIMKLTSKQKKAIFQILENEINPLKAIYLFGSYADDSATQTSDIDIAYLTDSIVTPNKNWEISNALSRALSINVDLVNLAQTDTIFRYQVISTGKRLYGSGYEVESFETLAYSFYLRFQEERKPILDAIYADRRVFHG